MLLVINISYTKYGVIRSDTNGLATALAKIAVHVAEILYENVTDNRPPFVADSFHSVEHRISQMLFCYLESAKCDLFYAASSPGVKLMNQVLPLYVGVHRVANTATTLTGQLLAYLTSKELPQMNETACYENHLVWMGGENLTGICINSTVNYSTAMSPAFIIDGTFRSLTKYDFVDMPTVITYIFFVPRRTGYDMNSGVYSTWTESIWQTLSVRMFLKPSAATERLSMILGSSVAGASFVLVWFINSRADILFNSR